MFEAARTGGEVDWSRDGTNASDDAAGAFAPLPGQLQRDVATEREAGEKDRQAAAFVDALYDIGEVAGLSGVIWSRGQGFGSAAASHVEPVDDESRFER